MSHQRIQQHNPCELDELDDAPALLIDALPLTTELLLGNRETASPAIIPRKTSDRLIVAVIAADTGNTENN